MKMVKYKNWISSRRLHKAVNDCLAGAKHKKHVEYHEKTKHKGQDPTLNSNRKWAKRVEKTLRVWMLMFGRKVIERTQALKDLAKIMLWHQQGFYEDDDCNASIKVAARPTLK